jgi:hypothetical protein
VWITAHQIWAEVSKGESPCEPVHQGPLDLVEPRSLVSLEQMGRALWADVALNRLDAR